MANPGKKLAATGALYLYGISRSAGVKAAKKPAPKLGKIGSAGIDGVHAVRTLPCGEFVCWVCEVDHAGFAQAMERNMENLEWLALHGVRHQQVVGEVSAQTAIVPARFGTIFSGEPALVKDVLGRKAALNKVFARVSGGDEWGVKVFAEHAAPQAQVIEARSGKDYLLQKAARMKKRPERNDQELLELAAALEKIATDSAASGKVSGAQPSLLWQATFLVPRAKRKQWDQALKNFAERWEGKRRIEVNGPWPPYSFVSDAD
ncbi:MAG TPA: GvpL/GvpF family gas vesicle protein [Candidatus Angelobacter sp.]|nr:GvpL/GvpF family gas vesicle protein [Candidatus Angelobacter sp.]